MAKDDPGKFATIAFGILPRDVLLTVEREPGPFDGMTHEQMKEMLETVRALRAKTIESAPSVCLTDGALQADEVKSKA